MLSLRDSKHLRDITNCDVDTFKSKLSAYLSSVPDEPRIPGLTSCARTDTNSLIDWSNYLILQPTVGLYPTPDTQSERRLI